MLQLGDNVVLKTRYVNTVYEDDSNFKIINTFAAYNESLFPYSTTDRKVEVLIKGSFPAPDYRYQELEVAGEWKYDKKRNQYELSAQYVIPSLPTSSKSVAAFAKTIQGIGDKISARLGSEFPKGIFTPTGEIPTPEWLISHVKGMSVTKSNKLCDGLRRINISAELTRILKGCVAGQTIKAIAIHYGPKAMKMVKNNPYQMYLDKVVSFPDSDAIAMNVGGKEKDAPERIDAGITFAMRALKDSRNAIIAEKNAVIEAARCTLNLPKDTIQNEFDEQIKKRTFVSAGKYFYIKEDYETERALAEKICLYVNAAQSVSESDADNFIRKFEAWKKANNTIALADKQEEAVRAVAKNPLTVLTGGPGTGKTTVLKAIMETYKKAFPNSHVTLMAPTGLAAKRMTDACGMNAATIHKTLGLTPSDCNAGFDDSNGMSIDGGLVIVDEVSMLGIHLAKFLFDAILFKSDTRIVLVGDVDQLPPVSPGAVLDDLICSGKVTVTRLNRNFRQEAGSAIVDAAHAINAGDVNVKFTGNIRKRFTTETDPKAEVQYIIQTMSKAFLWSVGEYGLENTFVLTPKRRMKPKTNGVDCVETMLSTTYLNPILRDLVNPMSEDKQFFKSGSRTFREGDRVISLKNTSDSMNGDIGYIKKIDKTDVPVITVDFDGKEVEYTPDRLKELELAYAITVHKSQGLEYKSIIYPTSMTHGAMLQRNLLYTAVTRAKSSVIIIGSEESFKKSILTVKSKVQRDLLSARIQRYAETNRNHM